MAPTPPKLTHPEQAFRAYLADKGLKGSRQRDLIAETFFRGEGHLTVDELLHAVRKQDESVSQATLYRTMKLLVDSGLAEARHFQDGQARYEVGDPAVGHHDHLICTGCGEIVEFVEPQIEALQDRVARREGFVVTHHKMELYGLCQACRERGA